MAGLRDFTSFHKYCTSPVFTVIAGTEETEFSVHAEVLREKSPMLRTLVDGDWKERKERTIKLSNWSVTTVSSFIEWLYTRDYQCILPQLSETCGCLPTSGDEIWEPNFFSMRTTMDNDTRLEDVPPRNVRDTEGYKAYLSAPLEASSSAQAAPCYEYTSKFQQFEQWEGFERHKDHLYDLDYEESLLQHAELHSLAQYVNIEALQQHALNGVLLVLNKISTASAPSASAKRVTRLLQYVFGEESESLRTVAGRYAAWNHGELMLQPEYRELLREGGEFAVMLAENLAKRLQTTTTIDRKSTGVLKVKSSAIRPMKKSFYL